ARRPPRQLQEQVGAVPEHDDADQHAHQRSRQQQRETGAVEHADGGGHHEVDGHHRGSSASRMSRSIPAPNERRRSSTTPTISRYTPTSRNTLVWVSTCPTSGTSSASFVVASTGAPTRVGA